MTKAEIQVLSNHLFRIIQKRNGNPPQCCKCGKLIEKDSEIHIQTETHNLLPNTFRCYCIGCWESLFIEC